MSDTAGNSVENNKKSHRNPRAGKFSISLIRKL